MKRLFKKKSKDEMLPTVQNHYYESVSERLGIVQVILYMALLSFVVLSLLGNTDLITYRNMYYFVKDLHASAEKVDAWNTESVSYPTDEKQSFSIYRQGLAVAGNRSVTVFTATGRQTVSQTIAYRNPIAMGSGKYLLVYDLGGKDYSLYNSYTQIFSGKTDYAISGATVSDTGMYALISSSDTYNSVVSLYNSNFKMINRFNKNGYVMDVAINSKGSAVAIVTSTHAAGTFTTELLVCRTESQNVLTSVTVANSLALSCTFTENDTVGILCSDGVYTYSSNGRLENSHAFAGDTVVASSVGGDGIAVCLQTLGSAERKDLLIFDRQGKLICRTKASEQVDGLTRYGNSVYIRTAMGIDLLEARSGQTLHLSCNTDQRTVLAVSENEILLCSHQKAVYMKFNYQ